MPGQFAKSAGIRDWLLNLVCFALILCLDLGLRASESSTKDNPGN